MHHLRNGNGSHRLSQPPDFLGYPMPVDDDLAAIGELYLQHTAVL
jgi:hypothetical protein